MGLFLETNGESRNGILDLDRKLGLARYGLRGDVLLLLLGLLLLLLLWVVVAAGMDIMLEWLVKSKVPKTEMLETHAKGSQLHVFLPRTLYFRR